MLTHPWDFETGKVLDITPGKNKGIYQFLGKRTMI
uniref:Uncharacterized protein n=1 Tax=Rhizophora mucronata TaxID=61149 RepID=A0A2P2R044_RHIMU